MITSSQAILAQASGATGPFHIAIHDMSTTSFPEVVTSTLEKWLWYSPSNTFSVSSGYVLALCLLLMLHFPFRGVGV